MQYLEAMDANPYEITQLTKKNKPFKLGNSSSNMMDFETFAALSACEIKCLIYYVVKNEMSRMHPISGPLAQNLLNLFIDFLASDSFVQSPLLMLNHLKVDHNLFVRSTALLESLKTLHKVKPLMLDFNFRSLPSTEYIL